MFIVNNKKVFLGISIATMVLAIILILVFGLRLSIDFTGGTVIEVAYPERPTVEEVTNLVSAAGVNTRSALVQPVGDTNYILRLPYLTEEQHASVTAGLESMATGTEIIRESAIGPSVGQELRSKGLVAIGVAILAIVLFIAFAFRKVSRPVQSWKYGVVAIIALVHDILIPAGVFALLGHFLGYEVDLLFVMAALAILGYSINDTIVVFDRIRENLASDQAAGKVEPFADVVGRSLRETIARSINTSLTTLLALLALYFIGSSSTNHFALMLVAGVIAGAYSSIFLASPLLVMLAGEGATTKGLDAKA